MLRRCFWLVFTVTLLACLALRAPNAHTNLLADDPKPGVGTGG
jgi:hypothetical protein